MAKELPYFKFEPSEWENGNIQMCGRESKGLFMDICSIYWSRLGELPYALALQKLCNSNEDALHDLINNEILVVIDDLICIEFLDEQLNEFENTRKQNSKNALEGWDKRRKSKVLSEKYASASNPQSESDAIREEKKREEKRKEEDMVMPFDSKEFLKTWTLWKSYKYEQFKFSYKGKTSEQAALKNLSELSGGNEVTAIKIIHQSITNSWKGLFELKQNNNEGITKDMRQYLADRKDI
jgi:hypothetical protein